MVAAQGGPRAGARRLGDFLASGLARYADERSHPDADAASGLSPWLHYGHVAPQQVLHAVAARHDWSADRLGPPQSGKKDGWWNIERNAEAFLDELVTWRELGFHFAARVPDYDQYDSLPGWARATLAEHAADPRPHVYDRADFEDARTHDELWNAAQTQLRRDGTITNYLRMVWGKKVLHWSTSPREALAILIELNNRWALDGRDPNSYSGIFCCLGRFDRAWGPERPVFGKVRFMTCLNSRRKLRLGEWLERFGTATRS
ncbi:MAG TPA: hypothetical protein VGC54_00235 [Planctomycetota bacterium]